MHSISQFVSAAAHLLILCIGMKIETIFKTFPRKIQLNIAHKKKYKTSLGEHFSRNILYAEKRRFNYLEHIARESYN